MVNASSSQKNIWVAASDGDLERVKASGLLSDHSRNADGRWDRSF